MISVVYEKEVCVSTAGGSVVGYVESAVHWITAASRASQQQAQVVLSVRANLQVYRPRQF